ncbi:hypothetical protein D3C71_1096510 [compost metagenome]
MNPKLAPDLSYKDRKHFDPNNHPIYRSDSAILDIYDNPENQVSFSLWIKRTTMNDDEYGFSSTSENLLSR